MKLFEESEPFSEKDYIALQQQLLLCQAQLSEYKKYVEKLTKELQDKDRKLVDSLYTIENYKKSLKCLIEEL